MKKPYSQSSSRRSKKAATAAKLRDLLYEQLEERVLFDAVPTGPVDPNAEELGNMDQANALRFDTSIYAEDVKTVSDAQSFSREDTGSVADVSRELVIVDTSVENYQQLVDDILGEDDPAREMSVVTINGERDGIEQVSEILAGYSDLDALHIVSHGSDIGVRLGDVWLTRDNLGGYAAEIAQWGNALSANGDLLILGCNLASSVDGRELVQSISTLTGADVATSSDDTGYAPRGGDWDLEYILGQMETSVAFSQDLQENWKGLLAVGPDVSISVVDSTPQIGDDVVFNVTFDNTAAAGSGDTGYAPFIDLLFPVNGADGAAGTDTADGLDFKNATYLGQSITAIELTFPDDDGATNDNGTPDTADDTGTGSFGTILHPYALAVQNELQRVAFNGAIDGGEFTLGFDGQTTVVNLDGSGGVLTAVALQSALESLSNIDPGDVIVTEGSVPEAGLFVEFAGQYAETDVAELTIDNTDLVNGLPTDPHGGFAVHTITDGSDEAQALRVFGTAGDKLVVLELPFGSVTPEQPEITVQVTATMSELADLYSASSPETELTVKSRAGFRYGVDELDNPEADPSLLSDTQTFSADWVVEASVQPQLMTITTDVIASEGETTTGPNYPRQFVVRVDIPEGQTIENLDITDLLPDNLVFLSLDSIASPDGDVVFTTNVPTGNNSQGNPTNNSGYNGSNAATPIDINNARANQSLVVTADEVTGASGADVTITFTGYVTEFSGDASGDPASSVIPVSGEDDLAGSVSQHTAGALGDWLAADVRDRGPGSTDNASAGPHSSQVDSKSISVQKSVSVVGGGTLASPGDILEYTLTFQISDYFTFDDLVLTDSFTDGQRFYNAAGFEAVFSVSDFDNTHVNQQFSVHVGAETSATSENASDNFIVDQSEIDNTDNTNELGDGTYSGGGTDPTDGSTTITIQLSKALAAIAGEDGILQGGHTTDGDANDNNRGAATGTITFYTVVQDEFSDDFASGDRSVDQDDLLSNSVTIAGSVKENEEDGDINNPSIGSESDTSSASIGIEVGTLSKSIYAVNGSTNLPASLRLAPGNDVTYRLTYTLPNSDFENLEITDFLPLPALVAGDFDGDDVGGDTWSFNLAGSFDATAPVAGVVEFGENDTFYNSNVANGSDYFDSSNITVDAGANSLKFDFGSYDDPNNTATTIDLLFTLTLQDDAFADGLFLTNIARAEYGTTNQVTTPVDALVQLQLGQPALNIKKGIVDTDNAAVTLGSIGPTVNDEYQTLTFTGSDTNGSFTLTYDGQTTSAIAVGSTAAQIQSALEGLSNVSAGDVIAHGTRLVNEPVTLQFAGGLAATDVSQLISNLGDIAVATELSGGQAISINGVGDATPFSGRITSGALASQLIDLDAADLEAGDTVRFMIVVENTGLGANGAFDVQLKDQLPAEFEYVAGSISVVDGQGTALTFADLGGNPDHGLFGNGITLDDPGPTGIPAGGEDGGALDSFSPYDGRNIAIITYDAKLVDETGNSADNIDVGETITNQAFVVNYAGAEGAEDHTAGADLSDSAAVSIAGAPALTKSIIGTSEAHTGNDGSGDPLVAIGEIIRYRVTVELPHGTTPNLRIYDNLPSGLTYVDDGTATVSFISDTPGSVVSSTMTAGAIPDDAVSRNAENNRDNYGSGNDVWFKLGDVTNSEYDDANSEFAVLEFNVLVSNNSNSYAGQIRFNDAQIFIDQEGSSVEVFDLDNEDRPRVTIVEPNISAVAKEISDGSGGWVDSLTADAQDTVTFRVSFNNGNEVNDSDAFDVRLVDSIPDDFTLATVQVYIDSVLQTAGADYVDNTSGNSVDLTLPTVAKNQSVEVIYTTTVDGTAQPSETLTNQAFLTWTSLPGDFGTANGAGGNSTGSDLSSLDDFDTDISGTDDGSGQVYTTESGESFGERNGSGSGENVYLGNDSASVTINTVSFLKEFVGTSIDATVDSGNNSDSEAVIGEEVQYKFTITVPEGTVNAAQVFDQLDEGLEFVRVDSISATAGLSSSVTDMLTTASVVQGAITTNGGTGDTGDAQELTFNLGNIVNSNSDNSTPETIEITYTVRVKDIVANQSTANSGGPSLNNVARFRWDTDGNAGFDQQTATSSAANVTIIEPVIEVEKEVVSVDDDAGNPIAYTITIQHNDGTIAGADSETDAYDLTFIDVLPDSLENITFTVVHSDAAKTLATSALFEYDATDHEVRTISGQSFDLLVGESITVAIASTIVDDVGPGQEISNRADVQWTSLDGAQTGERTGADGKDGALDDYATFDTVTFETARPNFTKELVSTSIDNNGTTATNTNTEAVVGETAIYRVTLTIPEGQTQAAEIVDSLELGLAFEQITSVTASTNVTSDAADLSDPSSIGVTDNSEDGITGAQQVTFNLGTITNSNNDGADETIVIEYRVRVANADGVGTDTGEDSSLVNDAEFQWDLGGSQGVQTQAAPSSPTITVIEPDLDIVKNVIVGGSGSEGDSGDSVQYTIDVTHAAGSTDAFDITFSDAVSSKITYDITGVSVIVTHVDTTTTDITSQFEVVGNELRTKATGPESFDLLDGETLQVVINGALNNAAISNESISNAATVTWTSLDDGKIFGSATSHERDGEGAQDDYTETSADGGGNNATLTVTPAVFNKTLFGTDQTETSGSEVTIGETVTYALIVELGEGTTPGLTIVDELPDGLKYSGVTVVTDVASSNGLLAADFNGTISGTDPSVSGGVNDGDDVTFTFGAITTAADNVGNNNRFLVLVDAVVSDVASNIGHGASQQTLTNIATLDIAGDGVATPQNSNTVDVDVVEPNLIIAKEFGNTVDVDRADAGDTMTIRLTVQNTGESAAYDVNVQDILSSAHYDTDSVSFVTTPSGFTAANTGGTVTFSGGTVNAGQTLTFEFKATLLATVAPKAVLSNTSTIEDGSTLEGTVAGERNTPDTDGDGSDSDSDSVTIRSNSVAGVVYQDNTNDGIINGSDAGIGGVVIQLTGIDHLGNSVTLSTTTSSAAGTIGEYLFDGLRAGTYTIAEVQPGTHLDGKETIGTQGGTTGSDQFSVNLPTGTETNGTGNNFGELPPSELTGFVYHDSDNDGVKDGGETGIEGAFMRLTGTNDLGNITPLVVETLADGSYSFDLLRPGTYKIEQLIQPPAYLDGKDADGSLANGDATTDDEISSIELASGETGTAYNFGEVIASTISGYVYHDSDNDGDRSDEPAGHGISGVTITLTGKDDLGADVLETATTNGSGFYEFTGLRPSDGSGYTITEGAVPVTYIDGRDTIGSQGGSTGSDAFTSVVASNTTGTENNFGEIQPARLAGRVFNDFDNDGTFDAGDGEVGIEGVLITLTGTDDVGNDIDVDVFTAADGTYEFTNLRPSDASGYTITETHPIAYSDGIDSDGSLANGDTSTNEVITSINVSSGDDGIGYNFAERGTSISGTVFVDDDRDGVQDGGEATRLGGVRIELFNMTDPGAPVSLGTTATGVDGTYSFDNLPAGDYRVVQTQPSQYGNTSSNTLDLTLPLTGSAGNNFGEALYDLGDTIYFDANNNGTQDGGEQGIGNVTVTLQYAGADGIFGNGDDPAAQTTTTDSAGAYSFTELFVGNYRISVTEGDLPDGVTGTEETDDAAFGAAVINGTSHIAIAANDRFDVDFGYTGSGVIGNFVWMDINGDGIQDVGEVGLDDITVDLIFAGDDGIFGNDDDLTLSTVTAAGGAYSFNNLPAGDFRIAVDTADADLPTSVTGVSGAESLSGTANLALAAGETNNDIDFGFTGTLSLGDRLWLDQDGNQIQNDSEPGLPDVGLTVIWFGQNGVLGGGDDITLTATTDSNGGYGFTNLPDGNYRVTYASGDLPANTSPTFERDGSTNNQVDLSLSGSSIDDVDYGFNGAGSISDFVWLDADGDGLQDAGEPGLADVDVILTFAGADGSFATTDDNFSITVATDSDGLYSFDGLPDGDFRVNVDTTDTDLPGSLSGVAGAESISGTADVTLNATQRTYSDIDFGFTGTRTAGDFVWLDTNGDGTQNPGEPGLGLVDVTLLFAGQDGTFGNADDFTKTTTTDANGAYSFGNLPDGNYRVSIDTNDLPTAVTPTSDVDGTLNHQGDFAISGADRDDIDFGYEGVRSIGDRFWHDADADGVQDAGEPGIVGVNVTLVSAGANGTFGDADDFTLTTVTGAGGLYDFDGLPQGDYRISFNSGDLPSGLNVGTAETDDAAFGAAVLNGTANVRLAASDRSDVDFGFAGARTLGDFVWFDQNGDGIQDVNEPGFGDVDVTLLFKGQDGTFGTADDVTLTTTTNAAGAYTFSNLPNGDYRISLDQSDLPAGLSQTFEVDSTNNNQADVAVSGSDVNNVDFGFRGTGSISDFVWLDANGDGVQDAGEPGLANTTVNLTFAGEDGIFGNDDDFSLSTVTNSTGNYAFNNLPAGAYRVSVDTSDTDLPGSLTQVSGAESVSGTASVTLAVGGTNDAIDFGFTGTRTLGNYIWFDANGDGVQDATNEPPLVGVDVTLIYAGQDGIFGNADDITKSDTTDSSGLYAFGNLADGDYRVVIDTTDLSTNAEATFDQDDAAFVDSNDDTGRVTIAGASRDDVDFGYRGNRTVGDAFYHDVNGNGNQDAGEPGIAGVEVTATFSGSDNIFGNDDDFSLTTTTSSTGAYSFNNLLDGDYRISFDSSDLPSGMDIGTDEHDDAAFTEAINGTSNITVSADRDDIDFGFRGERTLGNRLWFDSNGDGVQDATNEPGFVGVDVTLIFAGPDGDFSATTDNVTINTTTGANGIYNFTNLVDGNYRISYDLSDLPAGITPTFEVDATINNQADVTISGSDRSDVDFGFNDGGSISNQLWYDVNGDGIFNQYDSDGDTVGDTGEPGLAGVTVTAVFGGSDGLLSTTTDNFTLTTTTAADGTYAFNNLPQGEYSISVDTNDLPASFVSTHDKDDFGTVADDGTSTVALGDDETDAAVDFGFQGSNSVGDVIWFDRDGDGVQDDLNGATGEPGIGGVTVTLTFAGADGNFVTTADNVVLSTVTSASGAYQFDNLFDGDYRVAVDAATLPTGMTQTFETDGVALGDLNNRADFSLAGSDRGDIDFGYQGALSLGDTVWYDVDGNAVQDAGEPGLSNVDVNLLFAGTNGTFGDVDDFTLQTTTNSSGGYSLNNLPEGEYRVSIDTSDLPDGMNIITAETDDSAVANDGTSNISLTANRTDVDFGFRGARVLGDRIWFDGNGDGVQDATNEPGLGDVRVNLLFAGQDGTFGTADDVTIQDTTDANGNYQFTDLPDGNFRISVETSDLPAGMGQTFEIDGATAGDNNNRADIEITGSDTDIVDFGFRGTGTISDRVWHDTDGDGVQDGANEPGVVGVTVNLAFAGEDGIFGTTDDFTLTTATGADGGYSFDNLPAGEYRIDVVEADLPNSQNQTFERNDSTDAIAGVAEVALTVGQTRNDVDFGYTGTLTIGDRIWFDANNDGLQSSGEPGLPGIGLTLVYAGPDGLFATTADNTTQTTTTDSSGNYSFENLFDGNFTVTVTTTDLPGGAIQTHDQDDAVFGAGSLDHTASIALAAASRDNVDFGYRGNSSIGDLIFFDADNSGTLSSGDRGIPDVDVTAEVDVNGDNVVDYSVTVTTDINGAYVFENLVPGTYTITVDDTDLPAGMAANPTVDPNGTVTPHSTIVVLGSNEANRTTDFGYNSTGTIGDRVWLDTNNDGIQDATNEPGLANVGVTLTWFGGDGTKDLGPGGDDEVFTTTTGADGAYAFEFLPGGNYQIDVDETDAPGNTTLTTANNGIQITLPTGSSNDTIDFGFVGGAVGGPGAGIIGDRVYFDHNGNGVEDGDDVGYANVSVTITADLDGDGNDEVFTATTNSSGIYEVAGLPYGDYTVTLNPPNGTSATFDAIGVANNQSTVTLDAGNPGSTTQDFGLTGTGTVGDTLFFDEDGDGIQDSNEVGIPGVDVTIEVDLDGDGNPDFTTTVQTAEDGKYSFTNIPEGKVTVTVSTPTGTNPTTDHDATAGGDNSNTLNLSAGVTDNSSDFGYQGTGSIGNTIFFDADGDGTQDDGSGADPAEPGLPGVQVFLDIDFNGDGTVDHTLETSTAADGTYTFSNLPAGDYTIRVTQPAGTSQTVDDDGITGLSANQSSHTLSAGEDNIAQNFGYTGTGAITDTVFFDIDDDATEEVGGADRGLPGVDVTLNIDLNGDGNPDYTRTVQTDTDGDFTFANLVPGTYTITTDPTDMPAGLANNPTVDNDGTGTAHEANYTVAAGNTTDGSGFGFHATPDYDIVKTGNGDFTSARPGDTVSYTIVVKNIGELDGRNVTITDTFPTGVLSITDAGGGTVNTTDGTIEWDIAALAPNQQQIFTVTAEVLNPIAAGIHEFTNSVTVDDDHYNGDDPDTTNNNSSHTATLNAAPNYAIAKNNGAGVDTLQPGDSTTYHITVTNNGNQDGTGVIVTDRFPVGVLSVTNAFGGTVDTVAGTITWNIGDLDVGETVVLQPTFDVISPAVAGQHTLANVADISDDGNNGSDPDTSDNTATDTDTLNAVPDYRITKTLNGSPSNVSPNEIVTYSIVVENIGDQNGTGVVVTDRYPTDALTDVVAPGAASIDTTTGTITWNIGNLDGDGESVLLTVTGRVRPTLATSIHDLINDVSVTDDLSNGPDPTPGNNSDDDVTPILARPDLVIEKTDGDVEDVRPGETVVYTIDFANQGLQEATNVVITETVPEGSSFNFEGSTAGWVDQGDGTYTFEIASLPSGSTGTIEFAVTVSELLDPNREELENVITIADDGTNGPDVNPDNNTSEDLTPLQVFTFDSFQDFSGNGNDLGTFNRVVQNQPADDTYAHRLSPLPIDTVYTGVVDPGTTLSGKIYDQHGRMIGEQIVMADSAGNWLMQFPTVVLYEQPHEMRIDQTMAVQNSDSGSGFNMRRFFHPAVHGQLYMQESLSIESAFRHNPFDILAAMHAANNNPLGFGWMHHAYELVVSSSNASAM